MKRKFSKNNVGWKFWIGEIFFSLVYAFIIISISGAVVLAYLMIKNPLGEGLYARKIPQTTIFYDRTGQHKLYEMHGEENRKVISHEEIPDVIRIATIATEDDNFFNHHGVDIFSTFRALINNIRTKEFKQGGSTITQQLARNVFLNRDKTLERKVLEGVYALKLERKYSKDQILDAYLNQVPYGNNAYGIEVASEKYFSKPAKDLTLDESALLAALTKAPSFYSPYGQNLERLANRQKMILRRIASLELASPEAVQAAIKTNTFEKISPPADPIEAPHFVFYVAEKLEQKYSRKTIDEGGFRIITTLDWEKQQLAEKLLREYDPSLEKYGATNAALIAINPKNGEILAMAGSKNFFDKEIDGQVNVATRPRQPGSSFKPIVYAAAFEKGFQPETLVLDASTNFGPDGSGKNYIPRNYDGRFHGVLSIRQALAMSLNIPAIKTLREVGLDDAIEMAHRLGITTLNDRNRYGLSLVIGGGEVTLLDETAAFSVFANDGKKNPPTGIIKITDGRGKIVESEETENIQVIDPQIARKINSILSDNNARSAIFGPNNKLFIPGKTVAAKTGTTQEFRDAWTIGYTPEIAVGVWAGNNDSRPMRAGADGSYVAAPLWNRFISEAIKNSPDQTFLAYEKSKDEKNPEINFQLSGLAQKITYYKIASGKEISEKKAKKMGSDEVRVQVEYVSESNNNDEGTFSSQKPAF